MINFVLYLAYQGIEAARRNESFNYILCKAKYIYAEKYERRIRFATFAKGEIPLCDATVCIFYRTRSWRNTTIRSTFLHCGYYYNI